MSSAKSPRGGKTRKYENCPPLQLIIRDNKGWRLYKQSRKGKLQIQSPTRPCGDADIIFSDDGQYFAVILEEGVEIYESQNGRKLFFLRHYRVRNVFFSPNNNFIISYHHRRQADKQGNCWVWKWNQTEDNDNDKNDDASNNNDNQNESKNEEIGEGQSDGDLKVIYQFFLSEFDKKLLPLSFSNDEFIAARTTKNSVIIHDVQRFHYKSNNIIGKVDIANVASVVVAPCKRYRSGEERKPQNSYLVAVFAMPKNNKAATVTIYEYQYSLAMNKKSNTTKVFSKISQRAFYGVDQCELLWDPTSSYHHNLLAIASSDVDTSGKSYYGNQTLYLLSSRNNITVRIPLAEKGKMQDVKWHPYGKEFVMIDDHPQKITIFDYKGNEVKSLGNYARNLIRFSRDGRFLWCGGFGNLTGEMTFYDWKEIKNEKKMVLGYNTDDACRYFEWSPDSATLLTARLYPFMTVDNGFRIYKYNGKKVYEENFDRLYQIAYRPNLKSVYPQRSVSPGARSNSKSIPKPAAKKRYVPPHLRSAQTKASGGGGGRQRGGAKPRGRKKKQQQNQNENQNQNQNKQQNQHQNQNRSQPQQAQQQQAQQQQNNYNNQQNQNQHQNRNQNQNQGAYNNNNNGNGNFNNNYNSNYPQNYQQMGNNQNQNQNQGHGQQYSGGFQPHQPQQQQPYAPQQQQNQYQGQQRYQGGGQQQYNNYNNNNNNNNFQSGVYHHSGQDSGDYLQQQQQNNNQQIQQTQQQFQQMNVQQQGQQQQQQQQFQQMNVQQQQQQQQQQNDNNNNNNQNDGSDGNKKKKRRSRKKKNKGGQGGGQQQQGGGGNNGGFKPGLADNDKSRWARGSKYTE